jgi:hypothetical protein
MFYIYIASVLFGAAYVCNGFQLFLQSVSDACFECFIYLFFYMLQVLYLDVSKVDRMLHIKCA